MAMVQVKSYNFQTDENPLSDGGNFTIIADTNFTGSLQATTGICEPTSVATTGGAVWVGAVPAPSNVWPADQYSEITLTTWETNSEFAYLMVRQGAYNSGTQYLVNIGRGVSGGSTGVSTLFAIVAGVAHTLSTHTGLTTAQSDVWRISIAGNVITVSRNGTTVYTFTDTNNYIASGSPGFGLNSPGVIASAQTGLWAAGANQAATPTFSPVAGSYTGTQTITITSASGGTIYYTTDGTTPTHASSSIASGGTISLAASATVKAIASVSNNVDSATGSAAYVINSSGGGTGQINAGFGFSTDMPGSTAADTGGTAIVTRKTAIMTTKFGSRIIG